MTARDYEPASGFNLPAGCMGDEIDREFGNERRYCGECRHLVESDVLDCCVCGVKLRDAIAKLRGTHRWMPAFILTAVEDAVVYEDECCAEFEE